MYEKQGKFWENPLDEGIRNILKSEQTLWSRKKHIQVIYKNSRPYLYMSIIEIML